MRFASPPPRRTVGENIVPMINVVFLLLIFFLMTARIAPPEPFEITPPDSGSSDPADTSPVLYLAEDGGLAFGDARGDAVLDVLADAPPDGPLLIRADADVKARDLAVLLSRLAGAGITDVALATGVRK